MYIAAVASALPEQRYTQKECWEALQSSERFSQLTPPSQRLLRKVLLGENGIEWRHLSLEKLSEAFQLNPNALQARYEKHAPLLGFRAAQGLLQNKTLALHEVDALIVSTCTGYLCPGLSSYISEALGLRKSALLLDLVGQGCGAALPNLQVAESLITSGRAKNVISLAVEVSSAAFFLDDDPGVLISACLFADGAAAVHCSHQPGPTRRVKWVEGFNSLSAENREALRFKTVDGMLKNQLTREVPQLAGRMAYDLFSQAALTHGLTTQSISAWIFHAGGRDVLNELSHVFGLAEEHTNWSRCTLREIGNVSSPSVLFVLQKALQNSAPAGRWWLASFGAGIASHGALLDVT